MAATFDEVIAASDAVEEDRVMDGNILRKEKYSSSSLSTRITIIYNDNGGIYQMIAEDI